MIESISIKNFKSVVDLKLDLGQFNVLIGENGCGKSNILEGIAFGAAASVNKLDREFFSNRGIRITDPKFMYSVFNEESNPVIEIDIKDTKSGIFDKRFELKYNAELKPARWEDLSILNRFARMLSGESKAMDDTVLSYDDFNLIMNRFQHRFDPIVLSGKDAISFHDYLIFSLEESILRKYDAENAIHPLGRNGEGLFAYLKEISQREDGLDILKEIKENLYILDWFADLEIPKDQLSNEFSLQVKDKYVNDTLRFFDQRSTNEGFLYLLFYLTLFISDETPSFFAIDNLESSFNPKLCREITKRLIQLAKKHDKQVIVTTHSPAILDGLDITDNDERLFVIRRNMDGYTKANRVEYKTSMTVPLSEAWTKGYIGGLPENF
ncbi:AAA family ATPase [Bacteroides oleiciplenus]|uniref:ATPase AAA-type core domain-containing protein n=1 Tax=Bacteroides oleiciplenus YIT 12058 TaxID=742727 RepID=K9DSK4_9BACE|nr:AAA family ATPase [Bacteroides oleiciplenus]EKU87849.1 hypothetical protein HMPREF9447_04595 [Bacteroides oleiciplenus YIT 12058]